MRHTLAAVLLVVGVAACALASQTETDKTAAKQQQDKTDNKAAAGAKPQQPATPTEVALKGPITVRNEPDPKQEQREAEQRAADQFDRGVDIFTLAFAAFAAAAAFGAYRANKRSADAQEQQVGLLKSQIADAKVEATNTAKLTREALLLAHRPKLIVKEIVMPEATTLFSLGSPSSTETHPENIAKAHMAEITHLTGKFHVTNVGNADATGQFISAVVFVGQRLPDVSPAMGKGLAENALVDPFTPGLKQDHHSALSSKRT